MRQERCDKCRWWVFDETGENTVDLGRDDAFGGCHRYPPRIDPNEEDRSDPMATSFPQVFAWEFCGEWQSTPPAASPAQS